MQKNVIYYHRAYRTITRRPKRFWSQFLLTTILLMIVILLTYPETTKLMSMIARDILAPSFPAEKLEILQRKFLIENENIFLLIGPGSYPSTLMSFISSLVMLVIILLLQNVKKNKNIAIFVSFLAFIHMVSAVFFTLTPHLFPYTSTDFAELYVKTVIGVWIFIPVILSMALFPLPSSFVPKLFIILLTLIYSFVFATLRYAIFMYILTKYSFIYMALLFFAFGPLIDFVYVVGIYSVYVAYLAKKMKGSEAQWKWLF
jgi:hypothetical protein